MADSELAPDDGDPTGLQECADRYLEMLIGHSLEEVREATFRLPSANLRNILDDPDLLSAARNRVAALINMQLTTIEAEAMREGLDERLAVIDAHANKIPNFDMVPADTMDRLRRCNIMHDAVAALQGILSGDR